MKTFKEMIGIRIAARREAAGYTSQSAFAAAMDVDRARVSDWETGKREPKGKFRRRLLELLGSSESEIFGIMPPANEPPPPLNDPNWEPLSRLLQGYLVASPATQLSIFYLLTRDQKYLTQLAELPSGLPIARVLRKIPSTS